MSDYSFASHIIAPFLPILGPVHPSEVTDGLIKELYDSSSSNRVLPFDKRSRWSDRPNEFIAENGIKLIDDTLLIKTIANGRILTYIYGDPSKSYLSKNDTEQYVLITNSKTTNNTDVTSVIFLDEFTATEDMMPRPVFAHNLTLTQKKQIAGLGDADSMSGFYHLLQNGWLDNPKQPVIVSLEDDQVIGAIGPLTVLADSRGIQRLLPCYFGIKNTRQNQGIGTDLWRQSRTWALAHGAKYTILQARLGSDAERFYRHMELRPLGYIQRLDSL